MLAIPRKQRAMVRKGIKNGLAQRDRCRRRALLRALRRQCPSARHAAAAQALLRDAARHLRRRLRGADCRRPAEAHRCQQRAEFYFRDEVLPYYAGDDADGARARRQRLQVLGADAPRVRARHAVFDYGRSKRVPGPFDFKKNWGFEPQPLHYEYCLYRRDSIPQNNRLNPKYRAFIALWRRLPMPVANGLGPHMVRNLG